MTQGANMFKYFLILNILSALGNATRGNICSLESDAGPCLGLFSRWYFNKNSGKCEEFHYGGCKGNGNRFYSKKQCMSTCSTTKNATKPDLSLIDDVCSLESESGPCLGFFTRWYFKKHSGKCEKFNYGGCKGNENRFYSKMQCLSKCSSLKNATKPDDVCSLQSDPGPCMGHFSMWYFNKDSGKCEEFKYGGCKGNGNRFYSKKQCLSKCSPSKNNSKPNPSVFDNVCSLESDSGPCMGHFSMWHFNKDSGKCEKFHYGGCKGNGNRFYSKKQCLSKCSTSKNTSKSDLSLIDDVCSLQSDPGPCLGHFSMWYFDKDSGKCEKFHYGGCKGNGNRFHSKKQCLSKCSTSKNVTKPNLPLIDDVCSLQSDPGPCFSHFSRWYFDKDSKECKEFHYGGCKGNGNRFYTKKQCLSKCSPSKNNSKPNPSVVDDICSLESDPGPCLGHFSMWYFDKDSGKCKEFHYGGCKGNGNRFHSKTQCLSKCSKSKNATEPGLSPTDINLDLAVAFKAAKSTSLAYWAKQIDISKKISHHLKISSEDTPVGLVDFIDVTQQIIRISDGKHKREAEKKLSDFERRSEGGSPKTSAVEGSGSVCSTKFVRFGCYYDRQRQPRPLPNLLFTETYPTQENSSRSSVDWSNWNKYMNDFVCRCAKKAEESNSVLFSAQSYGECYGSENDFGYAKDGPAESINSCITNDKKPCGLSSNPDKVCIGRKSHNYVYLLMKS